MKLSTDDDTLFGVIRRHHVTDRLLQSVVQGTCHHCDLYDAFYLSSYRVENSYAQRMTPQ